MELKTGRLRGMTKTALGAGGRQFKSGRSDQWNQVVTPVSGCLGKPSVVDSVAAAFREWRRLDDHVDIRAECFQWVVGRSPEQKARCAASIDGSPTLSRSAESTLERVWSVSAGFHTTSTAIRSASQVRF